MKILADLFILILVIITASCKKQEHVEEAAPLYGNAASDSYELIYYSLDIQSEPEIVDYTKALKKWVKSLHRGLNTKPDNMSEEIFLKTNLVLTSGSDSLPIYQSILNPKRYLEPNHQLVIDFSTKQIGTLGVGGISLHIPPSKKLAVLIAPYKGMHFMGVLIGDHKTESPAPKFLDQSVTFQLLQKR